MNTMKDKIITAAIAIAAFLFGTLMPRSPKVETRDIVVYRDTSYSRLSMGAIKTLDIPEVRGVPSVLYIPETNVRVEYRDSIRYVVLDREHKFLENDDVKIWYSGVNPTIDSLQVLRKVASKDPRKRHSIGLETKIGYYGDFGFMTGATYRYDVFKWFSVSAKAGYNFYTEKPYMCFGLDLKIYSW